MCSFSGAKRKWTNAFITSDHYVHARTFSIRFGCEIKQNTLISERMRVFGVEPIFVCIVFVVFSPLLIRFVWYFGCMLLCCRCLSYVSLPFNFFSIRSHSRSPLPHGNDPACARERTSIERSDFAAIMYRSAIFKTTLSIYNRCVTLNFGGLPRSDVRRHRLELDVCVCLLFFRHGKLASNLFCHVVGASAETTAPKCRGRLCAFDKSL